MRRSLLLLLVLACGPPAPPRGPALPSPGTVHRKIITESSAAQHHFDLGLAHAYGFNFDAAKLEFEAALAADERCSMCRWGIAYSSGPNINERDKEWPGAYDMASAAAPYANEPVEQALARALERRYQARQPGNNATDAEYRTAQAATYAETMRQLAYEHGDDDDLQVLFAEAAMLALPIGTPYWPAGATPSPLIVEGRKDLERVLDRNPNHIGAIHFYIHLMEDSPRRELAVPYADKLAHLAPNAGHLLHMASHLYLRLGRYADAEDANRKAIAADAEMVKRLPPTATYTKFAMHPKHFLWQTLLWQGERAQAQKLVAELAPHLQHMAMSNPQPLGTDVMLSEFTAVRFSDWDAAIAIADADLPVAALATHYARGLAFVAKGRLDDAQREIELLATTTMENAPEGYRARLINVARIAHDQVSAAISLANRQPDKAVEAMQAAVDQEDHLDNPMEPPMWIFSSRERLGALLLKLGRTKEAADAFRSDLLQHPENGWSLYGWATALDALHDPQATAVWARFKKAWARSDVKLTPDLL